MLSEMDAEGDASLQTAANCCKLLQTAAKFLALTMSLKYARAAQRFAEVAAEVMLMSEITTMTSLTLSKGP